MGDSIQRDHNIADEILGRLRGLNGQLNTEIETNLGYIDAMILKIKELKEGIETLRDSSSISEAAAAKLKEELATLKSESDKTIKEKEVLVKKLETLQQSSKEMAKEKEELTQQLTQLAEINNQVEELGKTVDSLVTNNTTTANLIGSLQGGFQYNKKHPKYRGQSRSLLSNSKTTSRKRKKWRRRPGKSVKKGGMKTRRRRRNKKSKKSKKRRK
jgi:vacuolar-type H+-ATPase subunit I/STV1